MGLLEWERCNPQPLTVEVSLNVNLDEAAGGDLSHSVNYATTLSQVEFVVREGHWALLESLGAALVRLFLAPPALGESRAAVAQAMVRLRKPAVLSGRAVPSVELTRPSSWLALEKRASGIPGVTIEVLQEAGDTGAYRILLEPNTSWSIPAHMACMVIAGEVATATTVHTTAHVLRADSAPIASITAACLLGVSRGSGPSGNTGDRHEIDGVRDELPNTALQADEHVGCFAPSVVHR